MNFLFREAYWASLLILAGVLLIVRNVFKLDLPVMGIIFPVIIISWGISILLGPKGNSDTDSTFLFHNGSVTGVDGNSSYNVVFGKGTYDLRNIKVTDKNTRVDLDAVFSSAFVKINPNTPMKIKVSAVFASGRLPDGSVISFGDRTYYTKAYHADSAYVEVHADVVFGDLRIIEDEAITF